MIKAFNTRQFICIQVHVSFFPPISFVCVIGTQMRLQLVIKPPPLPSKLQNSKITYRKPCPLSCDHLFFRFKTQCTSQHTDVTHKLKVIFNSTLKLLLIHSCLNLHVFGCYNLTGIQSCQLQLHKSYESKYFVIMSILFINLLESQLSFRFNQI